MHPHSPWFRVLLDTDPRERHGILRLLTLSSYWFALAYLWQPLITFILPIMVGNLTEAASVEIGPLAVRLERNTYLGGVGAVGTLVAIVWQPMVGALSDRSRSRFGRRRPFIVAGSLGTFFALGLLSLATSLWWLVLAYVLLQLASNTAQGAYQGMLPDQIPNDQRGQASAFYGAVQLMAILVGSIVIGVALVPHGGTRLAILSMGAVVLIMAAVVVFSAADVVTTRPPKRTVGRALLLSFVLDARRYPDFSWLLLSRFLFLIGLMGIQQYLLYYLQALLGLSAEQASARAGIVLVTGLLVSIAFSFGMGYLSDRWSRKRIIAAAGVLGAVCCLFLIGVRTEGALLGVGVVLGMASGTFFSVDWALATDLVPKDEAGRYMGLSNVITAGAAIAAGVIMGPTIDLVNQGKASIAGYEVAFAIAAILFLAAVAALRRVREPERSLPEAP